tara:strand:+ start:23107 stop:23883 length:777 start_codon:yes stop_codon:yes gene_type:complete
MRHLFFLICFFPLLTSAQEVKIVANVTLLADQFIGIDPYKNIYYVKDMVLHKQGSEGNYVFNDLQLGQISTVDIINPLKVVVFYEDTNTVVLLDNKLSEMERINFNNLPEFINVSTATNAGSNQLWIFNIDTQQLELYNYRDNRKTTVSQPFSGKLISQASNFNYCYTLTEKKLRVFNIYGSILSETDAEGFTKIVQHEKNLVALKQNTLYLITENTINPLKIPLSENPIKDLQLTKEFLYIYDGNKLHTFSLTLPKQ